MDPLRLAPPPALVTGPPSTPASGWPVLAAGTGPRALILVLALVLTLVQLLGCQRLPELVPPRPGQGQQALGGALPAMEDSRGQVAPQAAQALLACRMGPGRNDLQDRAALEEAATGRPLLAGNRVTLLFDGPQTMAAMSAAVSAARSSIHLETYIFDADPLGQAFADLLIAKQREGVQVHILYDAVGTLGTPAAFFTRMADAGIQLCAFHPVNPLRRLGRWRINHRDHRKILVVDGRIGFTGGANISSSYRHGSLFRRKAGPVTSLGWRDTHLRLEGPAVAALQWLFVDTWNSQDPRRLDQASDFPPGRDAGDQIVRVVGSQPGSDFEIYRAYVLAMEQATRSIHLTSAYFVPDAQIVKALTAAAGRGVEVQILLTTVTDSSLVQHASQSHYQELLDSGVRLYLLNRSVLHAKTAVIDGTWSTVGSTNLDLRSFLHNREVNVIVLGDTFGRQMEAAFQEDLRNATELDPAIWRQRPRSDHLKEWAARLLSYWL